MPHERKIALARQLRKAMTEPERLLWARLKSRAQGIIFKRQQAIGPYVLDFFCYQAQLAVEVDGGLHDHERDAVRDAYFSGLALKPIALRQRKFIATPIRWPMVSGSKAKKSCDRNYGFSVVISQSRVPFMRLTQSGSI